MHFKCYFKINWASRIYLKTLYHSFVVGTIFTYINLIMKEILLLHLLDQNLLKFIITLYKPSYVRRSLPYTKAISKKTFCYPGNLRPVSFRLFLGIAEVFCVSS